MRKNIILAAFLLLASINAIGQTAEPAMADAMRADGKIYVVVLVLATIFAGIIVLLIRMDRKITKLEKEHFNNSHN